ncbi:1,4-alpha-glucan branching protein GlgB, partial [Methylococcus sp. S1B]
GASGVWELFIPELQPGLQYKFEISNRAHGTIQLKSDPYGRQFELRPNTATIITRESGYAWNEADWLAQRNEWPCLHRPLS